VFSLAARAVKAAVEDAGLAVRDVDGLATFGPNDSIAPNLLAPALGIESVSWYLDQFLGGSVSMSIIGQAAIAVSAGVADCVVCYRALNGRSGNRMNGSGAFTQRPPWDMQYRASTGYIVPAQEIAMAARAHMLRYGTTSEDLGRLAMLCRNHAINNPRAMMKTPLTMEQYLDSRWIVDPFRLFDCCLETDGAVAVAIVSADRAKDLPHRPVLVKGAAWGGGVNIINNGHTDLADSPARLIAGRLYSAAGVGPDDVDFAELYDCFTYTLLSQIEGYALCDAGNVPAKLTDGAFDRDRGELPINTAGGLLSEGYLHGMNHVFEAVEQIRGDAGARQISRHDTALVTGQLGYVSGYSSGLILEGA
jgi:acetyl-CoA acetyltransferase